jgi:hypothetical protein
MCTNSSARRSGTAGLMFDVGKAPINNLSPSSWT